MFGISSWCPRCPAMPGGARQAEDEVHGLFPLETRAVARDCSRLRGDLAAARWDWMTGDGAVKWWLDQVRWLRDWLVKPHISDLPYSSIFYIFYNSMMVHDGPSYGNHQKWLSGLVFEIWYQNNVNKNSGKFRSSIMMATYIKTTTITTITATHTIYINILCWFRLYILNRTNIYI